MVGPSAVVIPFGVPSQARGLGLGLAALLHGFAQFKGEAPVLAHIQARPREQQDAPSGVVSVEAFVPPATWQDLAGEEALPGLGTIVVTGSLEPPHQGKGHIELLAFDPRDGSTCARVDAHVDYENAGEGLVGALERLASELQGSVASVAELRKLPWDALEPMLLAESFALTARNEQSSRDYVSALVHFERALSEAPACDFIARRLSRIALDLAALDAKCADIGQRALARGIADAPLQMDLREASALLHLRKGEYVEAEQALRKVLQREAGRSQAYAFLSQVHRARNELADALLVTDTALAFSPTEPTLMSERGAVLAGLGRILEAEEVWSEVLRSHPLFPPAFLQLAASLVKGRETQKLSAMVDGILGAPSAHPDMLRQAMEMVLVAESEGVARASRLASLARKLTEVLPSDAMAWLVLGQVQAELGEKTKALEALQTCERLAAGLPLGAQAQGARFALLHADAMLEMDATLRSLRVADKAQLPALASRARRLAMEHATWSAHFVSGFAEQRMDRWSAARAEYEAALALAPGALPPHVELVTVCARLGDGVAAERFARALIALAGESAQSLSQLARAYFAQGDTLRSEEVLARVALLEGGEEEVRATRADYARKATLGVKTWRGRWSTLTQGFARIFALQLV